jgi:hypothetical protein
MLRGFGLMESNGGDTSSSEAGGGSGGRIAAYAKDNLFSGVGTYRAKGGASPATNSIPSSVKVSVWIEMYPPPDPPLPPLDPCRSGLYIVP